MSLSGQYTNELDRFSAIRSLNSQEGIFLNVENGVLLPYSNSQEKNTWPQNELKKTANFLNQYLFKDVLKSIELEKIELLRSSIHRYNARSISIKHSCNRKSELMMLRHFSSIKCPTIKFTENQWSQMLDLDDDHLEDLIKHVQLISTSTIDESLKSRLVNKIFQMDWSENQLESFVKPLLLLDASSLLKFLTICESIQNTSACIYILSSISQLRRPLSAPFMRLLSNMDGDSEKVNIFRVLIAFDGANHLINEILNFFQEPEELDEFLNAIQDISPENRVEIIERAFAISKDPMNKQATLKAIQFCSIIPEESLIETDKELLIDLIKNEDEWIYNHPTFRDLLYKVLLEKNQSLEESSLQNYQRLINPIIEALEDSEL